MFGVGEERCDSFPVRGNTITDPFYLLRPSTGEDSMQSSDQEPNAYRSAFTVVMRRKTSNYYNSEKAMVLEAENSLNNENEDNAGVTTTTTTETRECGFTTKCKCVLREDVGETPLINNRVRPTDAQRPLFREKSELLFGSRERSVSAPMGSTFEMTITGSKVEEAKDMMWLSCAKCLKNENNNGNNENERNKNNLESKEKENSSGNVNCKCVKAVCCLLCTVMKADVYKSYFYCITQDRLLRTVVARLYNIILYYCFFAETGSEFRRLFFYEFSRNSSEAIC